jgi:signal transduction histidine kinase
VNIGPRLTSAFGVVALILVCGAAVTGWEFANVRRHARTLAVVDDKLMAVYEVRADVGAIRRELEEVAKTGDPVLFNATARRQRRDLAKDIGHALKSFRDTGTAIPETLAILDETVDDQFDAMQRLATAQDWTAVGLRLDNQVEDILASVRHMVDGVNSQVSKQRVNSLDEIETDERSAQLILLATALTSLMIAAVLGLHVTRSIVRPLARLKGAAHQFAAGDFNIDIEVKSKDELGELSDAFKIAAQRLNDSYLELKRSNEALEQFAYAASHDLQEPLRTIANFSELLKRRHSQELSAEGWQHLSRVTDAAVHMRNLVAGILEYSRLAASSDRQEEKVVIEEVIGVVLENLQAIREQTRATITWGALPAVCGSRLRLIQLFQNLISNGIKYRRQDAAPFIHVSAKVEGAMWKFCVEDNGIGIDSKHHARIFGMFKQLDRNSKGGVGLGLAISKQIVEGHGGNIWVASEKDKGSRFYFTLKPADPIRAVYRSWRVQPNQTVTAADEPKTARERV